MVFRDEISDILHMEAVEIQTRDFLDRRERTLYRYATEAIA